MAISSSRESSRPRDQTHIPYVCCIAAAAAAKSLQSCPTLYDPIDGSPRGSPVPGILQARTLEWVAISFSNAWKWKVKVKSLSLVRLLATPWTAEDQAPPSMVFSRQEYWSGCHCLLRCCIAGRFFTHRLINVKTFQHVVAFVIIQCSSLNHIFLLAQMTPFPILNLLLFYCFFFSYFWLKIFTSKLPHQLS